MSIRSLCASGLSHKSFVIAFIACGMIVVGANLAVHRLFGDDYLAISAVLSILYAGAFCILFYLRAIRLKINRTIALVPLLTIFTNYKNLIYLDMGSNDFLVNYFVPSLDLLLIVYVIYFFLRKDGSAPRERGSEDAKDE